MDHDDAAMLLFLEPGHFRAGHLDRDARAVIHEPLTLNPIAGDVHVQQSVMDVGLNTSTPLVESLR
ncbi:hypothetical protein BW730_14720 [Tessaracoccus aquimaris]|uniref:Uncharacterized protein n=1 Tax=Tessaracoccus aquimaris TaxID=1332264 RepID=A0A1Q2CR29_9ACTN|nr:hypothetical protein BW730_14720 [Tessaracoccus aquimaris]